MFKIAFWMKKHLAMTWKRTWMWSTSPRVSQLDLGPLLPSEKVSTVQTTKRKKTKDGKVKWQGTKDLKGTQFFDRNLYHRLFFRIICTPTNTIMLGKKTLLPGCILIDLLATWCNYSLALLKMNPKRNCLRYLVAFGCFFLISLFSG